MAKSFKEIGKKAEALIEQGKEADQKVQACQMRVVSLSNRVAAARRQLAAANETDEEGNPNGDIGQARIQLSMAENQLAASQRALSSARGDAERVRQQKNAHVQEIERHNQVERSNLEKLRRLRSSAFGADSAVLTEEMALRLNEAEDTRVALLRSMGIDVTPEYVSVRGDGTSDPGWRGGGFTSIDTSGQVQRFQGGGSEGVSSNGGNAAPVGGGSINLQIDNLNQGISELSILDEDIIDSQKGNVNVTRQEESTREKNALYSEYVDLVAKAWTDNAMSTEERIAILSGYQKLLECFRQQSIAQGDTESNTEKTKILKKSPQQIYHDGKRYIDGILDAYRDNLLQRGVSDNRILDECIDSYRNQYLDVLKQDVINGTYHLYDHALPNFDSLSDEIKQRDLKDVEKQLIEQFGASLVQLDGFDPRVAHDMADALHEAKRDFPDLNIKYFGSCQLQAASMRKDLTEFYTKYFMQYRQPDWTDHQFNKLVHDNVEQYIRDELQLDDTDGTFAWSLNIGNSDPTNGGLNRYNGVAVNLDYARDYNKFKNSKVENVNNKYKPIGCDSPRATMDHELGHEIDRIVGAANDPVIKHMYQNMIQKNNAEETLSGYSQESIYEFIAEGYSEYRNNPTPRKLSTQIFNRLIELKKLKIGGLK